MAVVDVLISKVLDSLFSFITGEQQVKLVAGLKDEVRMLAINLQSIQTVLIDAEKRQLKEDTVKLWLGRLKLVSYEIDDVLDEWSTEILRCKIEGEKYEYTLKPKRSKVWSFVRSLCFCYREVGFHHDIVIKVRELNRNLDVIAKDKERYNFQLIQGISEQAQRAMTTSVVNIPEIKGRGQEKKDVMHLLFKESKLNPHVISLVGMAGIGKTTLAQLVYNEDRVKSFFEIRIWVCVSDPFDEMRIAKAILKCLEGNTSNLVEMPNIVAMIQKYIGGKRFLLVLDDVWNEDAGKWKRVKEFLNGLPGSKILVTTRKVQVARAAGCSPKDTIQLELLSNEECWMAFSQVAFPEGNNHNYSNNFEEIGRKIVEKCKGWPLAVNTIGGLLRFKDSIEEWQRVFESELWALEVVEEQVFAALRLSFDDLSPPLKQCFLHCAIFPEDYKMSRRQLIAMWASQGYIKGAKNRDVEMMGNTHFQNLCMCSFFQDFEFDEWGENVDFCKMNGVVHDFAQALIMKKEYCSIEVNNLEKLMRDPNENKILHVGVVLQGGVTFPGSFCTLEKLRSLVVLSYDFKFEGSLFDIFNKMTCLRLLSLNACHIEEVPPNISNLVHLRQLDLSRNRRLKKLPETTCKLYNLESLDVIACDIEELPPNISKLVHLRQLDLSRNRRLKKLPETTCKLYNLESLDVRACDIEELPPNISKLVHLRQLDLSWNRRLKKLPETTCKLYNLEILDVSECGYLEPLPREIGNLVNLKCLYNDWIFECTLPKEVGKLNGLQRLSLIEIGEDDGEALFGEDK